MDKYPSHNFPLKSSQVLRFVDYILPLSASTHGSDVIVNEAYMR